MGNQQHSERHEMKTPSRDDVARRAYELFQARGAEAGHAAKLQLCLGSVVGGVAGRVFVEGGGRRQSRQRVGILPLPVECHSGREPPLSRGPRYTVLVSGCEPEQR